MNCFYIFPQAKNTMIDLKAFESGAVDYEKVVDIMAEEKPNQKPKFKFSFERLRPLIPPGYADKEAEDYIVKALEYYKNICRSNVNRQGNRKCAHRLKSGTPASFGLFYCPAATLSYKISKRGGNRPHGVWY